jgi:hypothetical protein
VSKLQAENLEGQLDVTSDCTLDDLMGHMKKKLTNNEICLPSQTGAKFNVVSDFFSA